MQHAPIIRKIEILLEIISRNVYVVKSRNNGMRRMFFCSYILSHSDNIRQILSAEYLSYANIALITPPHRCI